jgi:hypothetical protein
VSRFSTLSPTEKVVTVVLAVPVAVAWTLGAPALAIWVVGEVLAGAGWVPGPLDGGEAFRLGAVVVFLVLWARSGNRS